MNGRDKILWITSDNFLDVDIPIVSELCKHKKIIWIVIFTKNRINSFTETGINKFFEGLPIKIEFIYFLNRLRSLSVLFKYIVICFHIRKINPYLIYSNHLGMPYFFPLANIILDKKKLIYAAHDVIDHVNIPQRNFISKYKSFIFSKFNNFHLYSITQQKTFIENYPNKKTFYAPLFVKDFGIPTTSAKDTKIQFLFFGTIRENKGLEYLIEAGNKLHENFKGQFIIKIAGKCNNWEKYAKLIKYPEAFNLQIEAIINDDIPNLYKSSHFLVLPYLDVTQSGPLMISYNYGVPAIASNLEGFKEYIKHNRTGFLFKSQDQNHLYEQLATAIKYVNNGKYIVMKTELKSFVDKNISISAISNKYLSYFNSFAN